MDMNIAKNKVSEVGFLDIDIDPSLDLFQAIQNLKTKKMPSFLHTITRSRTYRMWQTSLVIALAFLKKHKALLQT
jgi:hypothetical protein